MAASGPDQRAAVRPTEKRQLTVLSCKLAGSMTLAADLDSEQLASELHSFYDLCAAVVTRWDGDVAHAAGDEILASFGYPEAREDDAERAVQAGLDIVAKMGELLSPTGASRQARIALASGVVLIDGNRPLIGEAIVAATHVRDAAKPNSVVVAASTRKLLGEVFICNEPELCVCDGLSEPVTTYRIMGKRALQSRLDARTRPHTRLVGRQHEWQQLSMRWQQAKEGRGQVVLVGGEPGIGKSRLFRSWLDSIAAEPHFTLLYQCSPHHISSPFFPIIEQLEHAARFERADSAKAKGTKLQALFAEAGAATPADIALFATLLSTPVAESNPSPTLSPQRQRALTIAALVRWIQQLSLVQPVVIKIADAHWIDSSTLELFTRCIASIKTARVLVLCTFRPEFSSSWSAESHVTMLHLDRLSREHTRTIIYDVAAGRKLPCPLQEQIVSRADGIPLFAEELTKAVLESGRLAGTDARHTMDSSAAVIPTTLLGSLTARLDRLGPSKEIAQFAAAIGREFSCRLLAAIAPLPPSGLQSALDHLVASGLVCVRGNPPDATYTFKHALIQDAAYATMVRSKRQQLHRQIADCLLANFPATVAAQPETIAHHFAEAGLVKEAIEYLRKAGRRAIERSANIEAVAHLKHALELLHSVAAGPKRRRVMLELEVLLGQALIAGCGYAAPETRETLLRASALIDRSTDSTQKFAILYGIWACHYVAGEVAKQMDAAAKFLAEAERYNDVAALCIAHRSLGTTYLTVGRFIEGKDHLERARALYDSQHHAGYRFQYGQDIEVAALCYLSWAFWHLGYADRASQVAAEAVKSAEGLSHPHTLVYAICHARGLMDVFRHRCENTRLDAGSLISLCTDNGFSHWINCGRILQGWTEVGQGKVQQGIELLRAGILGWQKGGARLWLPFFLTLEAEACSKAGRIEEALKAINQALSVSKETGERWAMAELLRVRAGVCRRVGQAPVKEIESILLQSLEIARSQHARIWELRATCDLACLWRDQGQGKKGLELLESVYDQFSEGHEEADLRDAGSLMQDLRVGNKRRVRSKAEEG
jgi:class 3 adenylate cyclase/predicted ATPase